MSTFNILVHINEHCTYTVIDMFNMFTVKEKLLVVFGDSSLGFILTILQYVEYYVDLARASVIFYEKDLNYRACRRPGNQ